MCGRFTLATPGEILAALFEVEGVPDWVHPRYNIAPRTRVVAVRRGATSRIGQSLLWGAVNPRNSRALINARSETAATSPFFGRAFAACRVLIPADGFFEWTKDKERRQAWYFHQPGGAPFAFAGVAADSGVSIPSEQPRAVILTTEASASVRAYHDRMPLIVARQDFDLWLDSRTEARALDELMRAGRVTEWISHPVGPLVGDVRVDRADCIHPVEPAPAAQGRLF